jgi:hypothetical protein
MKMFLIKFESGEYLTNCRITSSYLDYERTIHKAAADRLNELDSELVVKRLLNLGQKNACREEASGEQWDARRVRG